GEGRGEGRQRIAAQHLLFEIEVDNSKSQTTQSIFTGTHDARCVYSDQELLFSQTTKRVTRTSSNIFGAWVHDVARVFEGVEELIFRERGYGSFRAAQPQYTQKSEL